MKMFRGDMLQTVFLLILFVILFSSVGGSFQLLSVGDIGYSTAFQGPKASFKGVKVENKPYDIQQGTSLFLDIDAWNTGKPNIIGEMTTIFVPAESVTKSPSWVPREWLTRNVEIKNPREPAYSWNISGKTYKMEQWTLKWYVSFSAEWDGSEAGFAFLPGEVDRHYYSNTEIWFEFDIKPTWYIAGGGTAYFAIAKIELAQPALKTAKDNNGVEQTADTQLSVAPEKVGNLYIYNSLYGAQVPEKTAYNYQGQELNPQYFTNRLYAKVTLANFGCTCWNELPGTVKAKGDVVGFDFDVTVFVIGEWQVQEVKELPSDWVRDVKTTMPPSLLDYLSDPRVQGLITLAVMAGLFILLLLFAPWVLIAIVSMFRGGSGRKRK